ncbi:MAG: hypothetical protein JNK05_10115 [Myxococcales bacterium]|nr:hypothetical protein [Myxococcales bacterium]
MSNPTPLPVVAPPPNEAQIAVDFAAAYNAVATVVQMAGGRARRLLVEEVEHTDWGKEIPAMLLDVAFNAEGDGVHVDSQVRHTILVALDEHGQRVATTAGRGWHGEKLLPAVAQWSREARAPWSWTRKNQPLVVRDGRFTLAAPPPTRALPQIAQELATLGWTMTPTELGFNATRARYGRDTASMVLLVVIGVLLWPLAMLFLLYMAFKKVTTGRWPDNQGGPSPWTRASARIAIDCAPGHVRVVRTQGAATLFDRRLDASSLHTLFSSGNSAFERPLVFVERDRTTEVSLALRGDGPRRDADQRAGELLIEAIALVWSSNAR